MRMRNFKGQSRDDVISDMYRLANEAIKRDNARIEKVIWRICSDWNRQNEERDEIFMSELWNDEEDDLIGFMIEDAPYYYNE